MANSNSNFIEFLSQNDPLGLLKVNTPVKPKAVRSILLSNFEEIVNFFEENNREPQHASTDIKEFQLYCRLKAIRESAEMVKELKDFDFYGLLSGSNISNITFDDIIGNDPLNLLGGDFNEEIFSLNHVKQTERISPEYISRRKFCRDFDKYQPMFEALQKDLEEGTRKLAVYHPEDLGPGNFYVLGGKVEKADHREYGKTEVLVDKTSSKIFEGVSEKTICWMSHFDYISQVAPGFEITSHTDNCPCASSENAEKGLYAIQFHPGVLHTQEGSKMLYNFVRGVCGCCGDWRMDNFVEEQIKAIREKVGDGKVLCALSYIKNRNKRCIRPICPIALWNR